MKSRSGVEIHPKRRREDDTCPSPTPKRLRLTAQNLRLHSDMPRKSRGCASLVSESRSSSVAPSTTTSGTFGAQLQRNGIFYEPFETEDPIDAEDVRSRLDYSRETASPELESWKTYCQRVQNCAGEDDIKNEAWCSDSDAIAKKPPIGPYRPDHNKSWNAASAAYSSLSANLSAPKPDYSECLRSSEYPAEAIQDLGAHICPTASHLTSMPTFAAEIKSRKVSLFQAEQQAALDAAFMTHADHHKNKYVGEETTPRTIQALTVTFNGDNLTIYGNHRNEKDGKITYNSTELYHHRPTASLKEYRASRRHVRNAQDWSRYRTELLRNRLFAYKSSPPCNGFPTPRSSKNDEASSEGLTDT